MTHLLGAQSITLRFPNRTLLDNITIGLNRGDRIGVVGRNGDGKSTLINILAGEIEPDTGLVTRRGGVTVGILRQRDEFAEEMTVAQAVVGDRPEYEWAQDPNIREVLSGLIPELEPDRMVATLSGGQRRRLALAHLLIQDLDVIMLDEPTNHLDIMGVHWLAQHLNRRWAHNQGALVIVTHDRWFLDAVTSQTWEVHDGTIDVYEGGYAAYILQRVERQRQASVAEEKRQNLLRKELAWLRRGAPARTSKPKFRLDAASALIDDVPEPRNALELQKLSMTRQGKDVIEFKGVEFRFIPEGETVDGKQILNPTDWIIGPGDRIGLLGRNGAGKSTIINLISGDLTPLSGRIKRGKTLKMAVLSQNLDELDDDADSRVREILSRYRTGYSVEDKEMTPAQLLERLGFSSDQLQARVKDLSGGQKRRLQLLLILMAEPNLLILDEPTNDMDTDMLQAIEDLLDSWAGTLIVISHDRYLLERVTDHQYALLNGTIRHLPRGVDEYLVLEGKQSSSSSRLLQQTEQTHSAGSHFADSDSAGSVSVTPSHHASGGEARPSSPTPSLSGAESHKLRREQNSIDRRLEKLSDMIEKKKSELAASDQSDYQHLNVLSSELTAFETEVATLEEQWLNNAEALGS